MGDRAEQLRQAVAALKNFIDFLTVSPVYECHALLPKGAPKEWNMPFLNMAIRGETSLTPYELLDEIQSLELSLGRVYRGHWGPREIDIDILVYDDLVLKEQHLTLPHAGLLTRDFALIPLNDIAPEWICPLPGASEGKQAHELAAICPSTLSKMPFSIT